VTTDKTIEQLATHPSKGRSADSEPVDRSTITPTVGRDVHHVARGSADGHYAPDIRAAKVTHVVDVGSDESPTTVNLIVWTEEGQFWPTNVEYHAGCDEDVPAFAPYYRCPINGLAYPGGTWHWPPRV
jgi:hypothetical protein